MPGQPRLDLAHVRRHEVQRSNDRQPCFFTAIDRVRYLRDLREIALREKCAVHALFLTPLPLLAERYERPFLENLTDRLL